MLKVTTDDIESKSPEITESLDELARQGARRMTLAALELEADQYVQELHQLRDELDHARVVRNGHAEERTVHLGAGTIHVRAPRVDDRRPDHVAPSRVRVQQQDPAAIYATFSALGRSPASAVSARAIDGRLFGGTGGSPGTGSGWLLGYDDLPSAQGMARRVSGLAQAVFGRQRLRLHLGRRCALQRTARAGSPGVSGDPRLWAGRWCAPRRPKPGRRHRRWVSRVNRIVDRATQRPETRGTPAPVLAMGDGGLGFWAALREVFAQSREQRCWTHKIANVLDKLPKRLQPRAKAMLHEIMRAPDRQSALEDIERFSQEYRARYPKAVDTLAKDQDQLLTFFDFPAEHWIHLRTTNPIESPFATVKARTKKTKGAGSRNVGLAMAFKLLLSPEKRWRRLNAPHLVALVRAGVKFPDGRAQLLQVDDLPEDRLFAQTPSAYAATEV